MPVRPITVACVNAGNYLGLGHQYVDALRRAVARYSTRPTRFICLTDDPENAPKVECIPLPTGLKGWWNKLAMFKPGVLPEGPVVFFDLDTVIVGAIDELLDYRGAFALLRDLMHPTRYGSGVMAWNNSLSTGLWEAYEAQGRPDIDGGDQAFIQSHLKADLLQDFVSGIYSYKVHCKNGLPEDARIVCFHGLPRPHMVSDGWVDACWRKSVCG